MKFGKWLNDAIKNSYRNYDEDGYPVTVPESKPQPIIPDSDHVPGELVIHDPDERVFRYPL